MLAHSSTTGSRATKHGRYFASFNFVASASLKCRAFVLRLRLRSAGGFMRRQKGGAIRFFTRTTHGASQRVAPER